MSYVEVAIHAPFANSTLSYEAIAGLELKRGQLVEVPLGRRVVKGVVLNPESDGANIPEKFKDKIKPIVGILDEHFLLTEDELKLYNWMSKYYHYSLGQLIFDCLPQMMKRPRAVEFITGNKNPFPHKLNSVQQPIVDEILTRESFSQSFIHGVTGSGKTLIYLHLIKDSIDNAKSALFLLPEINLTPQFIETFSLYLGCKILSYHSGITKSEKYEIWKSMYVSDEPVLLMGVRSSVFLPLRNLGVVIVDEEHDQSFKQDSRCPYNARDVAIKKAQIANCKVVLGSATPTVETYARFKGSDNYFCLKERVGDAKFPVIETIDIRRKEKGENLFWPLSEKAVNDLRETLEKGEQALVFINKLGFANFIQCRACGHQFSNEECGCGLNLRFFKNKNLLSCAHCEFKMPVPESCPKCANINLLQKGYGTERVHEVLQEHFKDYCIERFDRDEIKNFKQLNDKLKRFHSGQIDLLVGTQMLSKGHNFERVNLVLILGIDSQLNFADFRANEKTYQLVTQVAGRSGRYSDYGKVLIQTVNPEHDIFKYLKANSFDGFYKDELQMRECGEVPPFSKIAIVYYSSKNRTKLVDLIGLETNKLNRLIESNFNKVQLLGPVPSYIEKKANQFTWMFMLKSDNVNQLHNLINTFSQGMQKDYAVSIKIDVDPYITT
jgi:primosomal protein N' (replication factor Y) (superfamily II helicase)